MTQTDRRPALDEADRKNLAPWLTIAAILAATTIALHLEGRLWTSASGQIRLWVGDIWTAECSQQLLDPYSITHLLHGFVLCGLTAWAWPRWPLAWRLTAAVGLEAAWEVFENSQLAIDRYRQQTAAIGYEGDTVVNSLCDIVCCAVGFLVAWRLGWRWSLAVFIALELILIFWIRDSLVLNVLMLVVPLRALKTWQMGH